MPSGCYGSGATDPARVRGTEIATVSVVSGPALHKGLVLTGCLLAVFVAEALALIVTSGSGTRRRSRFWLRFLGAGLTMPGLLLTLVLAGRLGLVSSQLAAGLSSLVVLCCVPAMMLVPALLFDFSGPAPGEEGDGGGGRGPEPPPIPGYFAPG
jgi:hypothetical protein